MPNTTLIDKQLRQVLESLFAILSDKEKNVIERRYALKGDREETLAKIGQRYNVTRERIRQIESSAIKKLRRHVIHTPLQEINKIGTKIIDGHSGIIEEEKLLAMMSKALPFKPDRHYLILSLELDPEISKVGNTGYFAPHWKQNSLSMAMLKTISDCYRKILDEKAEVQSFHSLTKETKKRLKNNKNVKDGLIHELLSLDKEITVTEEGFGLSSWAHINPQTIRQKIFFVLRLLGRPMHFTEITEKIKEGDFDEKKVNIHTVHNELIRNINFIHVGRGIYALGEWGYYQGNVRDVIENILKTSRKPLTREEIIKQVLLQRKVKKITIILNLKNDERFHRVGRNRYKLEK